LSEETTSVSLVVVSKRNRLLRLPRLGRWFIAPVDDDDPYLAPDDRRVPVAGHAVPRHFTGGFQIEGGSVEVTVRMHRGEPIVERVEIIGTVFREGPVGSRQFGPVSPELVRRVAGALRHEVPRVIAQWAPLVEDPGNGYRPDTHAQRAMRRDTDAKLARTKLTAEHLSEVARIYRDAPSLPRQAVVDYFGTNENTASRWIRAARERGLLGSAPGPGVSGEVQR
jgi:hypothetical protein